jgi:hypothetical protein
MGRTFKKGGSSCPSLFVGQRNFPVAEIGEAAMITHAPESKVIAASSSFELRFFMAAGI